MHLITVNVCLHGNLRFISARRDNTYKGAGTSISVSVCNGGGAGNCLAECLFNLIAIGEYACAPTINDVPHSEIQNTLEQVGNYLIF